VPVLARAADDWPVTASRARTVARWLIRDTDGYIRLWVLPATLCAAVLTVTLVVLSHADADCEAAGGHVAAAGKVLYCAQG
jgi:hypothetical protein